MPTVKVHNLKNKEVGSVELSDAVFGVELNEHLIHSAVKNYLQNKRQGTSATKTRGDVRGGGKKPWKQKGTGRARVASIRSPLWKGGGKVHGPQPRDWSTKMPKKMRRGALRSALSERLREENVIIIDDFTIDNSKTKSFIEILTTLGLKEDKKHKKTLIVDSLDNQNLILSSRNIQKVKVINSYGLNVYDLLYHEKLILSKSAVEELNGWLDPTGENDAKPEEPKAKKKAKKSEDVAVEETVEKKPAKKAKAKKEEVTEEAAETEEVKAAETETKVEETPAEETKAEETTEEEAK
jgi:large subunit ribosomal protein L4